MPENFTSSGNAFDVFGDEDAEIVLVTYGRIFADCYEAYNRLKNDGLKVKIIKLNIIVPVPQESLEYTRNAKNVFFFEEGVKSGGIGESFATLLLENQVETEFSLTAFPDCFVKQGKVDSILKQYSLDSDGMYNIVTTELNK